MLQAMACVCKGRTFLKSAGCGWQRASSSPHVCPSQVLQPALLSPAGGDAAAAATLASVLADVAELLRALAAAACRPGRPEVGFGSGSSLGDEEGAAGDAVAELAERLLGGVLAAAAAAAPVATAADGSFIAVDRQACARLSSPQAVQKRITSSYEAGCR